MNLNFIFILIIIIIIGYYYSYELFSADNQSDMNLARALQRFIRITTSYEDYTSFLIDNKNMYSNLQNYNVFSKLKNLKKVGKLTIEEIGNFMT